MFLFGKRFFSGSALQLSIEKFQKNVFEAINVASPKRLNVLKSFQNYALLEGSLPVGSVVEFADGSFGIVNFVVKKRVLALTFNRKVREGAAATALHNRFLFKFEFSSFGSCVDVLGRPVLGSEPANRRTALAQLLEDRFGHKKVFLDVSGRECVPFLKRVRLKSVYRFRDLLLDSFCPVPYGSSLGIFGDRNISMARVRKILATIARNNCNLEYRSEAGLGGRKTVVVLGVSDYSNSHINRLRSDFLRAAGSDALAIASESTASPLEKVLVPLAAFAVGEFLSHHGFDAFVVLDDLAMHSKQRNELLSKAVGDTKQTNIYATLLAKCGVYETEHGVGSLTAICAASKNVVGKTNRLFYDAWADLESNCDSSLHLDKIFVDTDLNSARFANFVSPAARPHVQRIADYVSTYKSVDNALKLQQKMGLDEMDMMEKVRHLRRQRKLLRMISDFDGLAEEESLALLVSVGATGILDSVAEEHVLDFGNEFLAELRKSRVPKKTRNLIRAGKQMPVCVLQEIAALADYVLKVKPYLRGWALVK